MADVCKDANGKYDNIATLKANADRLNDGWMTMQISFMPNQGLAGTHTVEVKLGGEVVYKDDKVTNGTGSSGRDKLLSEVANEDKTILFTNHWDSQGYRILIGLFSSENSFQYIVAPTCLESLASNRALFH
jgi:hypothetical protein